MRNRLQVVEGVTAVEGRVSPATAPRMATCIHALDPAAPISLNLVNVMHAHGELVVRSSAEPHPADAGETNEHAAIFIRPGHDSQCRDESCPRHWRYVTT